MQAHGRRGATYTQVVQPASGRIRLEVAVNLAGRRIRRPARNGLADGLGLYLIGSGGGFYA